MATAIGTYAVWTAVKVRMQQNGQTFGTGDDTEGPLLCNQVNGWIEAKTGRVLAPVPVIATTITAGGTLGSTSITLGSASGVAIGDALMFGAVTATHEHGIVTGVAGNVCTLQWPLAAAYANGTVVERCQLFDVEDMDEGGRFVAIPDGMVYAKQLEAAFYTGGAYFLVPTTDWFLRPTPMAREPGWPATELWMTDVPSSSNPAPRFSRGLQTVRLSGCQPGWPAMPDEIVGLAEKLVVAAYRAKASGGGGTITVGTDGQRVIERLMDASDWRLINSYSAKEVVLI